MSSIPNSFKHNMIGGFRQADVMKYIKQIAKQRNEYRDRSDSMESTLAQLTAENEQLKDRIAQLEAQVAEGSARRDAHAEFEARVRHLADQLETARGDLDLCRGALHLSQEQLSGGTAIGSNALENAGNALGKLLETLSGACLTDELNQEAADGQPDL